MILVSFDSSWAEDSNGLKWWIYYGHQKQNEITTMIHDSFHQFFIVHSTYGWIYGYLWFISMLNLVLALYVHTHQHWRRCERFEILIMTWDQSRKILNSMPNMMLVGMMNQFTILMMVDWWILSTVLRTIGLSKDLITNSIPQYKRKLTFNEIKNELEFDFIR